MQRKAIIFDKDGTLVDNSMWPRIPCDELYPFAAGAVRLANQAGFLTIIMSNQPWVSRGLMDVNEVELVFLSIEAQLQENGARLDAYYYSTHAKSLGHPFTKPLPGMIWQARQDMDLDLGQSWMVGDSVDDVLAARAAGVRVALLETGLPADPLVLKPDLYAANCLEALKAILSEGEIE